VEPLELSVVTARAIGMGGRFEKHANMSRSYVAMFRPAKAMALTAYDLLAEPALIESAQREFAVRQEI
jgi:hypothetical protein